MENARMRIIDLLETSPVIAAVTDEKGLRKCFESDCEVVFILFGNLCNIAGIVDQVKNQGKTAIVHVDFISGLSSKEVVVDFIKQNTRADGIISTKPMLVKRAQDLGMYSGQRTFLIDSIALGTLKKQIEVFQPDFIEIMPGINTEAHERVYGHTDRGGRPDF